MVRLLGDEVVERQPPLALAKLARAVLHLLLRRHHHAHTSARTARRQAGMRNVPSALTEGILQALSLEGGDAICDCSATACTGA